MSSFLYATPLLKQNDGSYITSTCLRNPGIFPSRKDYNEYLLISSVDLPYNSLQIKEITE